MIQFLGHIVSATKGGATLVGAFLGGGTVTFAATLIGDSTGVTLGVLGGIVVVVFAAGRTLQKIYDGQKSTDARLSRIEKMLKISETNERKSE